MGAFNSKVDIGNRALQHCGSERMGSLGFDERSKRAAEVSFVYDKVREAELQRNVWTFATRRTIIRAIDTTTLLLSPALWSSATTYFRGSIVYQDGNLWISNVPSNIGNDPILTNLWEPYFGPLTVSLYASTETYSSGEIVYTFAGDGTYRVYLSMVDGNADNPATATAWSATTTYYKNQVVTRSSVAYISLIDLSLNKDPALAPALWSAATTYASGATVGGSNGTIYQSVVNGNHGNDPTTDTGVNWTNTGALNPWSSVFTGGSGSVKWLEIGGAEFPYGVALTVLNLVYPIGAGPSSMAFTQNVFRLPAGFLRIAPQNPKVPIAALGGPTGQANNDWQIENGYILSSDAGPIRLRFVANVTDVTRMHTMFCEGLAARIGLEVAQPITQSDARLKTIAGFYEKFMDDAHVMNAIESGYDDPPDDPYVTVRL